MDLLRYFCLNIALAICPSDEGKTILSDSVCDGIKHCPDGEDETPEMDCSSKHILNECIDVSMYKVRFSILIQMLIY